MAKKRKSLEFSVMATTVVLAAVLAGVWLVGIDRETDSQATLLPDQAMSLLSEPKPLIDFALTDDRNRPFDLASLKGKWSFVFFGYTHCPDVCPTTLATLARARSSIAKTTGGARNLQFVFVSVDPNRDTAGRLRQYVEYFDTSFVGVTGNDVQIANLAGQLGAAYQVAAAPGLENYPVYHTTALYLVDPQARYRAVFTPPLDAEAISRRFKVVRGLEGDKAT
jgi:protein SCO1